MRQMLLLAYQWSDETRKLALHALQDAGMRDLFTADLEVGVDAAGILREGGIIYSIDCVARQHLRLLAAGGVCREEGAIPLESSRQQVLNNGLL